jgi:hypothetical protein
MQNSPLPASIPRFQQIFFSGNGDQPSSKSCNLSSDHCRFFLPSRESIFPPTNRAGVWTKSAQRVDDRRRIHGSSVNYPTNKLRQYFVLSRLHGAPSLKIWQNMFLSFCEFCKMRSSRIEKISKVTCQ